MLKSKEKVGLLANEEKNKINDNSEITRTDSTLGICPSYSLQWPVTSTPPAAAQIQRANKELYCNCCQQLKSACGPSSSLFFNFYLCFVCQKLVFWVGGRLYWCSLMPEILTEKVKHTLKNEEVVGFCRREIVQIVKYVYKQLLKGNVYRGASMAMHTICII